jgi:4-amino-4-deoxy-L-arabinose transferase-like glycosyltransferase
MALLLALLGIVPMANLVTTGQDLPGWGAAVRVWLAAAAALVLVSLALARLLPGPIAALERGTTRLLLAPSPRAFTIAIGLVSALIALGFGWYLFAGMPVSDDEVSQLWQARLLGDGRLFARSESPVEFFSTAQTLQQGGRWFSEFPVGGPAVLAIGLAAGAAWLVNPILTGVAAAAFYRFVSRIDDEATARFAAILLALCPFFFLMGGSQMNHTATVACIVTGLAALAAWRASPGGASASRAAALLGGSLGVAATIRPFDAAIVAVCIGVVQLHAIVRRPELRRSLVVQLVVGSIPVVALLAVNDATVGSPFTFAYDALNGAEHRPGFHRTPLGFDHTPRRGLFIVSAYLMKLDLGMLGWPVPVVPLAAGTLLLRRAADVWDRLLLGILAVLLAGCAIYWDESYFLGPRYLFVAAPIVMLYVARLPGALRERLRSPTLRAAAGLFIPLSLAIGWLTPPLEGRVVNVWGLAKSSRTKASVASLLDADARRNVPPGSLVLIDDGWHARLAARLRSIGVRPLTAEQIASSADACSLQRSLDAAERLSPDSRIRLGHVMADLARDAPAAPVPGLASVDQLAFVPGRALTPDCQRELRRSSGGVTLAELLPYQSLEADGALGGPIVYVRDFGPRNELLRARFGNRTWFTTQRRDIGGRPEFRFFPYQAPPR